MSGSVLYFYFLQILACFEFAQPVSLKKVTVVFTL